MVLISECRLLDVDGQRASRRRIDRLERRLRQRRYRSLLHRNPQFARILRIVLPFKRWSGMPRRRLPCRRGSTAWSGALQHLIRCCRTFIQLCSSFVPRQRRSSPIVLPYGGLSRVILRPRVQRRHSVVLLKWPRQLPIDRGAAMSMQQPVMLDAVVQEHADAAAPWPQVAELCAPGNSEPMPLPRDTQDLIQSCSSAYLPPDARVSDEIRAKIWRENSLTSPLT